jgi:hypothetical protein
MADGPSPRPSARTFIWEFQTPPKEVAADEHRMAPSRKIWTWWGHPEEPRDGVRWPAFGLGEDHKGKLSLMLSTSASDPIVLDLAVTFV